MNPFTFSLFFPASWYFEVARAAFVTQHCETLAASTNPDLWIDSAAYLMGGEL